MPTDNRVSASLSPQDLTDLLAAVATIRAKLPFLLPLNAQERTKMAKMGDKSIGFDEKCTAYMASNPEFTPGFVSLDEVKKDRDLRVQMMRFYSELNSLAQDVDDTLMVLGSEIWMADLAYYQSVREAAKRGRTGAQVLYDDLRQRFPGPGRAGGDTPAPVAAAPAAAHS